MTLRQSSGLLLIVLASSLCRAARAEEEPMPTGYTITMIDLADQNYPVSAERAREQLGWEPRHLLRETLPDMIDALLDDPKAWYEENGLPVPDELPQLEATGARK